MEKNHEIAELELEKARIDVELKRTQLEVRRSQLSSRPKRSLNSSPLTLAVITGILGLIGIGIGNYLQSVANLKLEQEKAESALILKAIETGDRETAAKNLAFLVQIGLIHDKTGKIVELEAQPMNAPVLPSQTRAFNSKTDCGLWQSITSNKRYILRAKRKGYLMCTKMIQQRA